MSWVIGFGVLFGLCVLMIINNARRAGRRELSAEQLSRSRQILSVTVAQPGAGWQRLGRLTTADGLNLKFDHNDDPQAEAMLLAPGVDPQHRVSNFANTLPIQLSATFQTFHVHTAGYIFKLRARGTGKVVDKTTRIQMVISTRTGEPVGGKIENDDDDDAAVGDWIEVESAEILAAA